MGCFSYICLIDSKDCSFYIRILFVFVLFKKCRNVIQVTPSHKDLDSDPDDSGFFENLRRLVKKDV
jgi:hypothetical protein